MYEDPCQREGTTPDLPATTVDAVVAALGSQATRDASAPVDVTVDGHAGQSIILHVPGDAAFSECDGGQLGTCEYAVGLGRDPSRYHQAPGQIDEFWVVDVNGVLVVFDLAYYEATPQTDIDDMRAIVESATFSE